MTQAYAKVDPDLADEVATFLRTHPSFLADNPDLYRVLHPPVRVHGEQLTDHMAAMIRAERAHAAMLAARSDGLVTSGRAAAGLADRVQDAVLSLMEAGSVADWVETELPSLLGLDAAALCVEHFLPGTRRLPQGTIARVLSNRPVVFRDRPADAQVIHAEAALLARHDALIRVTGFDGGRRAMLALASRDPCVLHKEQGTAALVFLGRAVAAALRR